LASFSAGAASPPGIPDRQEQARVPACACVHDFELLRLFSFTMPPVTGDGRSRWWPP
jgi:hypothetical protein